MAYLGGASCSIRRAGRRTFGFHMFHGSSLPVLFEIVHCVWAKCIVFGPSGELQERYARIDAERPLPIMNNEASRVQRPLQVKRSCSLNVCCNLRGLGGREN